MTAGTTLACWILIMGIGDPDGKREELQCGSYCLTVALKSFDVQATLEEVEDALGELGSSGYSLNQIEKSAKKFGLFTTVSKSSIENLKWRKARLGERFACLTLIRNDHFVLLTDIQDHGVSICDPPEIDRLDLSVFERIWSGNVLLISDAPIVSEEYVVSDRQRWRLARTVGFGILGGLTVAFLILKVVFARSDTK